MRDTLRAAGWIEVRGNRWTHPDLPTLTGGRRRIYTEAAAIDHLNGRIDIPVHRHDKPETRPDAMDLALQAWLDAG